MSIQRARSLLLAPLFMLQACLLGAPVGDRGGERTSSQEEASEESSEEDTREQTDEEEAPPDPTPTDPDPELDPNPRDQEPQPPDPFPATPLIEQGGYGCADGLCVWLLGRDFSGMSHVEVRRMTSSILVATYVASEVTLELGATSSGQDRVTLRLRDSQNQSYLFKAEGLRFRVVKSAYSTWSNDVVVQNTTAPVPILEQISGSCSTSASLCVELSGRDFGTRANVHAFLKNTNSLAGAWYANAVDDEIQLSFAYDSNMAAHLLGDGLDFRVRDIDAHTYSNALYYRHEQTLQPTQSPSIDASGHECDDGLCIWLAGRYFQGTTHIDVRTRSGSEVIARYEADALEVQLGATASDPDVIRFHLRDTENQSYLFKVEGLRFWVVNRHAGIWSNGALVRNAAAPVPVLQKVSNRCSSAEKICLELSGLDFGVNANVHAFLKDTNSMVGAWYAKPEGDRAYLFFDPSSSIATRLHNEGVDFRVRDIDAHTYSNRFPYRFADEAGICPSDFQQGSLVGLPHGTIRNWDQAGGTFPSIPNISFDGSVTHKYSSVTFDGAEVRYWTPVENDYGHRLLLQRGPTMAQLGSRQYLADLRALIDDVSYIGQTSLAPGRIMTRLAVSYFPGIGYVGLGAVSPQYVNTQHLYPAIIFSADGLTNWQYLGKLRGDPAIFAQKQELDGDPNTVFWSDGGSIFLTPEGKWRIFINGMMGFVVLESDRLDGEWRALKRDGSWTPWTSPADIAGSKLPKNLLADVLQDGTRKSFPYGAFPHITKVSEKEWHLWVQASWPPSGIYHLTSNDGMQWQLYGAQPEISASGVDGYTASSYRNLRAYYDPRVDRIVGIVNGTYDQLKPAVNDCVHD